MARFFHLLFLLALLASPAGTASAQKERDLCYFLGKLYDLDGLAILEQDVTSKQASSYDRRSRFDRATNTYVDWRANSDRGNYQWIIEETGEAVLADLKGPGCINRIWSANPEGTIRFYIDGAEKPLAFPFADLCTGRIYPFVAPMVWQRGAMLGGDNPASNFYFPIPYAKSCRVTVDKAYLMYYHVGYTTFPPGTKVKSFSLPLSEPEKNAVTETQKRLKNLGRDPQPRELTPVEGQLDIEAGQEALLAEIAGPATICLFRLGVDAEERDILRKVLLEIYWDNQEKPAVQSPLGDFFGQSFSDKPYQSLPLGFDQKSGYCYFRMPFAEKARILVLHRGKNPLKIRYEIGYQAVTAQPEGFATFHAGWRREKACTTFDYPVLECKGTGKFIGMALYVDNVHGGLWDEGEEKIFVDGEKFPSYFGTGTGDYFGDAWGIRDFECQFNGCRLTGDDKKSCHRWNIPDPIPFKSRFFFTIENYLADDPVKNDYASIAYWYQRPGGSDFFTRPTERDCLPLVPSKVKGALEAENLYEADKLPQGVKIVEDIDLGCELSAGAGLELTGQAGSFFYLPLLIPRRDVYRINLVTAPGQEAATYAIKLDEKPLKGPVFLEAGRILLKAEMRGAGKNVKLILDYFELEPTRKFITKWVVTGPFDNPENKGLSTAYPPEKEEKLDRSKSYSGISGNPVAWKNVEAGANGKINLLTYIKPGNLGVAYACAVVESPSDMETDMYIGSDDGVKVWINGAVVHDHRIDRGLVMDADGVVVKLQKGINRVLVKVDQGGGEWGFCLRFRDDKDVLVYKVEP